MRSLPGLGLQLGMPTQDFVLGWTELSRLAGRVCRNAGGDANDRNVPIRARCQYRSVESFQGRHKIVLQTLRTRCKVGPVEKSIRVRIATDLLREARAIAAEEGTSLNGLVTNWMEELVAPRKRYKAAHKRAMARLQQGHDLGGRHSVSQDEVHHRSRYRSAK